LIIAYGNNKFNPAVSIQSNLCYSNWLLVSYA